ADAADGSAADRHEPRRRRPDRGRPARRRPARRQPRGRQPHARDAAAQHAAGDFPRRRGTGRYGAVRRDKTVGKSGRVIARRAQHAEAISAIFVPVAEIASLSYPWARNDASGIYRTAKICSRAELSNWPCVSWVGSCGLTPLWPRLRKKLTAS